MKYYFETEDSEICYSKEYFQELMRERELTQIEVLKAKPDFGQNYFYCKEFQEIGEKEGCGKKCPMYWPNNGKSGRCKEYGYCYENTGELVTLKRNK